MSAVDDVVFPAEVTVKAWNMVRTGVTFPVQHQYVEMLWLPVIGPSSTWLLRRLSGWSLACPDGLQVVLPELSESLGLGWSAGPNSSLQRSMRRLMMFGLAQWTADAFEMFMSRMFLAVPLIDRSGRYTGCCVSRRLYDSTNADRVFAAEHDKEEADEELRVAHRIGQSDPDSQHWLHTLFVRGTWLSLNFVHGFLGLGILLLCESVIHRVTMLACLIPMFLTLSESVGMQSTHLATHPDGRKRRRFEESLAIELLSSVALGLLCCSVVGLIAFVWHSVAAALVVSFSMFTSIFTTGAAAHLLPHMLRRFNIDPRAASAPIVLAIADLVTLGIVFGVAKYFL